MEFDRDVILAGYKLAIRAMEALIRTHAIPQRIDYFFDVKNSETGDALKYIKYKGVSDNWTTAFMMNLASKNAVKVSGNYYATSNRFYLETLLKESKTGSLRLLEMIRESMGMKEQPVAEPVDEQPEEIKSNVSEDEPANDEPTEEVVAEADASLELSGDEDTAELIRKMFQVQVMTLQRIDRIAENIIYVRDRFELRQTRLVDRLKGMDARFATIEEKVSIPVQTGIVQQDKDDIAEIVSSSVNSLIDVVQLMREGLQQTVIATAKDVSAKDKAEKLASIQSSVARVTSEFTALHDLVLEYLPDNPS